VYNGPGKKPWQHAGPPGTNGQRRIGTATLKTLMGDVSDEDKLPAA
jgi:hypothetical protein